MSVAVSISVLTSVRAERSARWFSNVFRFGVNMSRSLVSRWALAALFLSVSAGSLSSSVAQAADFVYATGDIATRRWQSSETPTSFDVKKDQKLEVVVKKDGWVRVRQSPGPKFGWIPETLVTSTVPVGVVAEEPASPGLEGLSPEIRAMLEKQLQGQMGGGMGSGMGGGQ